MQDKPTLEDTLELMRDLRRRCEWDRAQTHDSLRPYLIEEEALPLAASGVEHTGEVIPLPWMLGWLCP